MDKDFYAANEFSLSSEQNTSMTRKNVDFHSLFRSIPAKENLISSFACALSRDILLQGRLFISNRHACFYANILGWITSVVIPLKDVVSIDKRTTALVFPNAIQVATLHHRYVFTSFVYRDEAFNLLINFWKKSLPECTKSMESSRVSNKESIFTEDTLLEESAHDEDIRIGRKSPLIENFCPTNELNSHYFVFIGEYEIQNDVEIVCRDSFQDSRQAFFQATVPEGGSRQILDRRHFSINEAEILNVELLDAYNIQLRYNSAIYESTYQLSGLPGGVSIISTRFWVSSNRKGTTNLYVSANVCPPARALFPDAIKNAICASLKNYVQDTIAANFEMGMSKRHERQADSLSTMTIRFYGFLFVSVFIFIGSFMTQRLWRSPILFDCSYSIDSLDQLVHQKVEIVLFNNEARARSIEDLFNALSDFQDAFS